MDKSHVTMVRCVWCKKETGELLINKKLKPVFDMYTDSSEPCEECLKDAVIVYDENTKKLIAFLKKENVMTKEAIEQYKGTPVRALGKLHADGSLTLSNKQNEENQK